MNDTICKCFTGRMSRLINCLNGFDDRVNINISDSDQIGNIIIIMLQKYSEYDVEFKKDIIYKELLTMGFAEDIINEWLIVIE